MRTQLPLAVLNAALTCSLVSAPAHARARVFVASYGNDANPCTFGSPCKTFQQAVSVADAGGEVTAIDSAGFGPISITRAVTITSPDGVEAGIVPAAGGDAIDINAGPNDSVVLRGLTLNGSDIAFNGVVFNSGASLTITDCVMQNFLGNGNANTGNGILIQPIGSTVQFAITNTRVVNNTRAGVSYIALSGSPAVNGVIDHVIAIGNTLGIHVNTIPTSGGTTNINISDSVASNNTSGIDINAGPTMTVTIDHVILSGNFSFGIRAFNTAGSSLTVELGRSVITNNTFGVGNQTSPNGFFSYEDNRINSNSNGDITSPLAPLALK
jgi:hypothetical protein